MLAFTGCFDRKGKREGKCDSDKRSSQNAVRENVGTNPLLKKQKGAFYDHPYLSYHQRDTQQWAGPLPAHCQTRARLQTHNPAMNKWADIHAVVQ